MIDLRNIRRAATYDCRTHTVTVAHTHIVLYPSTSGAECLPQFATTSLAEAREHAASVAADRPYLAHHDIEITTVAGGHSEWAGPAR
jgi:hypothetical protein